MVNSSEVPGQYIWSWNAGTDNSSSGPKVCSACNSCQQARVKCSGGTPCRRCSNRDLSCTYSLSMRNGRLKASRKKRENTSVASSRTVDSSTASSNPSPAAQSPDKMVTSDVNTAFDSCGTSPFDVTIDGLFNGDDPLMAPSYQTSMYFLNDLSFQPVVPPMHAELTPISPCSNPFQSSSPPGAEECTCFWEHHGFTKRLEQTLGETFPSGLDQILALFRDCLAHTTKYLICDRCGRESSRLINNSLMLQRIVGLLCNICKNGQSYLSPQPEVRLRLGSFELSDDEELMHKKLLLTQVVKKSGTVVQDFISNLHGYQQKELMGGGKAGLTESSLLNLKWLFDTARNLESRLKLITELMNAPEWPCGMERPDTTTHVP